MIRAEVQTTVAPMRFVHIEWTYWPILLVCKMHRAIEVIGVRAVYVQPTQTE